MTPGPSPPAPLPLCAAGSPACEALPSAARSPAFLAAQPAIRLALGTLGCMLAPRWRASGRWHVPPRGAVILAPNHISDLDWPYLFAAAPRPLWFMAKRELFDMQPLGPMIRFC